MRDEGLEESWCETCWAESYRTTLSQQSLQDFVCVTNAESFHMQKLHKNIPTCIVFEQLPQNQAYLVLPFAKKFSKILEGLRAF